MLLPHRLTSPKAARQAYLGLIESQDIQQQKV